MTTSRRVAITGLGCVTPIGHNVQETWFAALAGKSGIGPITRFDATEWPAQIAGEVRNFQPELFMDSKEARKMDLFTQFGMVASLEAVKDAGLDVCAVDLDRAGVLMGSGMGGLSTLLETANTLREKGVRRISPFFIPATIINLLPGQVSMRLGWKGPNFSVVSACSTSNHAIAEAYHIIKRGDADVMICGGAEAVITDVGIGGFVALRALSTRNDEPMRASRPFDLGRDGFVMGEGAGAIILEDFEHAQARGVRIYAEVIGAGMTADAYHLTAPSERGEGALRSMRMALRNSGVEVSDIGYINAHGTSTPVGDSAESDAICQMFESEHPDVPVSSTKSMTGHLLGAAGAVEAVFCILALRDQKLPPTINYETPDPTCPLDVVPNQAREAMVHVALSNSFGFGGTNSTLVFRSV